MSVPVSYTHLDVYKRQTVNFAATDDAGDIMTTAVTNLPAFASFLVTGNGAGKITFNPSANDLGYYPGIVVTVSYTHLDVYKRQL